MTYSFILSGLFYFPLDANRQHSMQQSTRSRGYTYSRQYQEQGGVKTCLLAPDQIVSK